MSAPPAGPAPAFLHRLTVVEQRLAELAPTRSTALTDADAASGERWDQGQVWAHLAEFCPYWVAQVRLIVAADDDPAGFGRTKADPGRIAAIAERRHRSPEVALRDLLAGVDAVRTLLCELPESAWGRRGRHPTLGVMSLERIVEEFIVGHLEEHAAQLEALTALDA